MTRFSDDHPVRRWSHGRFAFWRAAVAPLVLGCIWWSGRMTAAARVTLLSASGPGMSPSAPTSMAWDSGAERVMRTTPRCGPSGSRQHDRAFRKLQLVAPPSARPAHLPQTSLEQQQYLGTYTRRERSRRSVLSRPSTIVAIRVSRGLAALAGCPQGASLRPVVHMSAAAPENTTTTRPRLLRNGEAKTGDRGTTWRKEETVAPNVRVRFMTTRCAFLPTTTSTPFCRS